jgi:hypothetical protein
LHEASPPPSLEAYTLKAVIEFRQGTKLESFFIGEARYVIEAQQQTSEQADPLSLTVAFAPLALSRALNIGTAMWEGSTNSYWRY